MNPIHTGGRKGRPSMARLLAVGAIALPLAACNTDKLLDVTDPALLPPSAVNDPNAVNSLYLGALSDFYIAYSGNSDTNNEGYVPISGVLSDELYVGDTFTTRIAADQRQLQPVTLGNVSDGDYLRLQRARTSARRAAVAVHTVTPNDLPTYARLKAVEAYAYVTLGEGWCGNVPISYLPDSSGVNPSAIIYTRGFTTAELMDSATVRFNDALTANSTDRLAQIGKARALLMRATTGDVARLQAAAAAVASVPTTYVFQIQHSANAGYEYNPIWVLESNGRYGVSNREGSGNRPDSAATTTAAAGFPYRELQDPRIPYIRRPTTTGRAFSSNIFEWYDYNYPVFQAPVPLASGVEARLIEAEAALASGDSATWLAKLNSLRAQAATLIPLLRPQQIQQFPMTLAPLTDPGTQAARIRLMFQERALWLFDTGHRLGDMRREMRFWGLTESDVYPTGAFTPQRGGSFGHDKEYPVPFNEQNNIEYSAALCNTTVP
jgi:hypothetical protein